jgi:MFS family permease
MDDNTDSEIGKIDIFTKILSILLIFLGFSAIIFSFYIFFANLSSSSEGVLNAFVIALMAFSVSPVCFVIGLFLSGYIKRFKILEIILLLCAVGAILFLNNYSKTKYIGYIIDLTFLFQFWFLLKNKFIIVRRLSYIIILLSLYQILSDYKLLSGNQIISFPNPEEYGYFSFFQIFTIVGIALAYLYTVFNEYCCRLIGKFANIFLFVVLVILPFLGVISNEVFLSTTINKDKTNYLENRQVYYIEDHNENFEAESYRIINTKTGSIKNVFNTKILFKFSGGNIKELKLSHNGKYALFIYDEIKNNSADNSTNVYLLNIDTQDVEKISTDLLKQNREYILWSNNDKNFAYIDSNSEERIGDGVINEININSSLIVYNIETKQSKSFPVNYLQSLIGYHYDDSAIYGFVQEEPNFNYRYLTNGDLMSIDLANGKVEKIASTNDLKVSDIYQNSFFTSDGKSIVLKNYDMNYFTFNITNKTQKILPRYSYIESWSSDLEHCAYSNKKNNLVISDKNNRNIIDIGSATFKNWLPGNKTFIYKQDSDLYISDINKNIYKLDSN